jgi:tetratricopeptide (TPR) repeat protein
LLAGKAALARQDAATAVTAFERAAAVLPGDAAVEELLGEAKLLARRPKEGLAHFERARALGSGGPKILFLLATALWEVDRLDEAELAFRQSLSVGGGDTIKQQLGKLLMFVGRYGEALEYLEAAARRRPEDLDLALDLANALAGAGRQGQALELSRQLVARKPDVPEVHYRLARALLRSGDRAGAQAELDTYRALFGRRMLRQREEGELRARLDMGWDLFRRGRPTEALALFQSLPESVESLCGLAFSRSASGDHPGAVRALERAVTLAPSREDLRRALAEERLAAEDSP